MGARSDIGYSESSTLTFEPINFFKHTMSCTIVIKERNQQCIFNIYTVRQELALADSVRSYSQHTGGTAGGQWLAGGQHNRYI